MAVDYRALARADALRQGIDPNIFERQIAQESGFNPTAHSGAGAEGIAQFMPGTAAGYHIDPMNPVQALAAAALMDKQNLSKYGSYASMLSAYNSGNPNAYKDPNFAGGQTYRYVKNILDGQTATSPVKASLGSSGATGLAQAVQSGATTGNGMLAQLVSLFQNQQQQGQQSPNAYQPIAMPHG